MANCTALACNYTLDVANITNMYQAHLHLGNKTVADGKPFQYESEPIRVHQILSCLGVKAKHSIAL
jgi:hypothetical protein